MLSSLDYYLFAIFFFAGFGVGAICAYEISEKVRASVLPHDTLRDSIVSELKEAKKESEPDDDDSDFEEPS